MGDSQTTVRADIDAGICGFNTTVRASGASMREIALEIESDCSQIAKAAENLATLDMMNELRSGIGQGRVYEELGRCVRHVTCPVGSGILKAAEAAAGLALPKDASIKLVKE